MEKVLMKTSQWSSGNLRQPNQNSPWPQRELFKVAISVEWEAKFFRKHWPSALVHLVFLLTPTSRREPETLEKETSPFPPPDDLSPPQKQVKYDPWVVVLTWGPTFPGSPWGPSKLERPWKGRNKGNVSLDAYTLLDLFFRHGLSNTEVTATGSYQF